MKLYAESSAVLAWLLGEADGEEIREQLSSAELVLTSELTLVECDRVLIRSLQFRAVSEAEVAKRQSTLNRVVSRWNVMSLDSPVIERARRPFALEPIRTLDALHLASALVAKTAISDLVLLSLDSRIRDCAYRTGFDLFPPALK
jgi:predicted nucleic acid-binding protein